MSAYSQRAASKYLFRNKMCIHLNTWWVLKEEAIPSLLFSELSSEEAVKLMDDKVKVMRGDLFNKCVSSSPL